MTPDELLAAAYSVDGPAANRALYAKWAATYDDGFIVDSGYQYHRQVAAVFAQYAAHAVRSGDAVIDIGCGTGLAGQALRALVDVTIDGVDISAEMLNQAAAKRHGDTAVYRSLIEADLTHPLSIPSATYAGAISVGTFTHGHVGPAELAEALRILRSGAVAAIGINAAHFQSAGFGPALAALESEGRVTNVQLVDVPIYADTEFVDPDRFAHVAVLTIA